MTEDIIFLLECLGTIAFAASGVFLAAQRGLDIFGITVLAVTTAVGGGTIRDVLLGITPPTMLIEPLHVVISVLTVFVFLFVRYKFKRFFSKNIYNYYTNIINLTDAVGLGIFTIVGMNTAYNKGYSKYAFLCIFVGVLTGVGGGMLRDILIKRIPVVLQREVYAVASIFGGGVYFVACKFINQGAAMIIGIILIVTIRLVSLRYNIHLPKAKEKGV